MIDLYTWATPNGRKASILLEELGLPYSVHTVDITQGEEFTPAFLAINPDAKIPAIVDHDAPQGKPITLFESGAILIYLAEKRGRFFPPDPRTRYLTLCQNLVHSTIIAARRRERHGRTRLNFAIIYPHFAR